MEVYKFAKGDGPLLISSPHSGTFIPDDIKARMTEAGRAMPDTDWHVDRLYGFLEGLNVPMLTATHSRYVADLNRATDDQSLYPGQFTVGLLPEETFEREAIYRAGEGLAEGEKQARVSTYWQPYHDKLAKELGKIKARYGYALLWDAHSIKSEVPAFFEGRLPDLNFGTNEGKSCNLDVEEVFRPILQDVPAYSSIFNGRFKGGFITRHYGKPEQNIHAIQLELSQITYMDEADKRYDEEKAAQAIPLLRNLVAAFKDMTPERA